MRRIFKVQAEWDEEAKVFFSESDISGLHIEADTIEEFEALLFDMARELIVENHLSAEEIESSHPKDVIPVIVYNRRPEHDLQVA